MANHADAGDDSYVPDWSKLNTSATEGVVDAGFYPSFHGMWHLKDLGVADDLEDFHSSVWERLNHDRPVRVAIMDTAVAWDHPNLVGAIDLGLMRDFQSSNDGAFVVEATTAEDLRSRQDLIEKVKENKDSYVTGMSDGARQSIMNEVRLTRPESVGPATHGTAVAGLIGARPAEVDVLRPIRVWEGATSSNGMTSDRVPLAYSGVNPFCRIVPISTTAAPDPDMILAAVQYARLIDAQLLVIAAAWEDTHRAEAGHNLFNPKGASWKNVEAELEELGKTCIILCAAGNSGTEALAYPASLSNRITGLFAVTACLANGKPVTYTAVPNNSYKSLSTIGGEAPRFDRKVDVIDRWAIKDFDPGRQPGGRPVPAERLMSLDPPGYTGANPSPYRYFPKAGAPHLEIGSLYAEFTGTSAAVAVAAGLISLALQTRKPDDGTSKQNSRKSWDDSFAFKEKDILFDVSCAEKLFS